jgi:[ribosomal protein S18]-alanine N-acetyltransferase
MAVLQAIRSIFSPAVPKQPEAVGSAPASRYSIRPLTKQHLKELIPINRECFPNGDNYTKHTFSYLLEDTSTLGYRIDTAEGLMAGFLFVMLNPDGAAHITTVGVLPAHRRRGLADRLLAHLEHVLRIKGISTVALEVRAGNLDAQRLYHRAGFMEVQRLPRYYNDGEDGLLMIRSLA